MRLFQVRPRRDASVREIVTPPKKSMPLTHVTKRPKSGASIRRTSQLNLIIGIHFFLLVEAVSTREHPQFKSTETTI